MADSTRMLPRRPRWSDSPRHLPNESSRTSHAPVTTQRTSRAAATAAKIISPIRLHGPTGPLPLFLDRLLECTRFRVVRWRCRRVVEWPLMPCCSRLDCGPLALHRAFDNGLLEMLVGPTGRIQHCLSTSGLGRGRVETASACRFADDAMMRSQQRHRRHEVIQWSRCRNRRFGRRPSRRASRNGH